jgi:choline kinase
MPTTNLALILAAGNGSRLASRSGGLPKPLVRLHGQPLLEHVMRGAHAAGIVRFVIVVGYRGDMIQRWYESHPLQGVDVTWVENPDYHKDNGVSVLRAKPVIREPFLLMMADHIFDLETPRGLLRHPLGNEEVILAVDRNIERVFDLADATKVKLDGEHIVDIGKNLTCYDALDTGMFHCHPALFFWLEKALKNGNCSLSDGMRLIAREGAFQAFDIGDAWWQDIDTPEALECAMPRAPAQPSSNSGTAVPLYA